MHKRRRQTWQQLPLLALALALSLSVAASPCHAAAIAPVSINSLALLQRSSSPSASVSAPQLLRDKQCVAVVVADGYLLAQASCIAELARDPQQPLKFAAIGVFTQPVSSIEPSSSSPPRINSTNNSSDANATARVLRSATAVNPAGLDVAPIRSVTYHPQFISRTTSATNNSTIATPDNVDNDFAVVEYAHASLQLVEPLLLLNNTLQFVQSQLDASAALAVLQIDCESLKLSWHGANVTLEDSAACGLDAASPMGQRFACVRSPSLQSSGSQQSWSLLYYSTMGSSSTFEHFFGFASGASRISSTQSFLWPRTAIDFVAKPTVYGAIWTEFGFPIASFPGSAVTYLPSHLAFVAGLRLHRQGPNVCGGSLVGSTFVLTAAHCIDSAFPPAYVSVGSVKTSGTDEGEQIKVLRIIRHPLFDSRHPANDIALIELVAPSIQIPVPILNSPGFKPLTGKVFGYGAMDVDSDVPVPSERLRFGELSVIPRNAECERLFQEPIDTSMFCAGGGERQKDACVGDSGGPLLVTSAKADDYVALAGVVSYGRGVCGVSTLPGVYANVTSAEQFIRQHVIDARWTSELAGDPFPSLSIGVPSTAPSTAPSTPPTLASPVPATASSTPSSSFTTAHSGSHDDVHTSGGGTSAVSPSTHSSAKPDSTTLTPSSSDKLELPMSLSLHVKNAFVSFLVGETDQISSNRMTALMQQSTLVLRSTQRLDGIDAVLSKYSAKALNQRATRFPDVAMPTAALQC